MTEKKKCELCNCKEFLELFPSLRGVWSIYSHSKDGIDTDFIIPEWVNPGIPPNIIMYDKDQIRRYCLDKEFVKQEIKKASDNGKSSLCEVLDLLKALGLE